MAKNVLLSAAALAFALACSAATSATPGPATSSAAGFGTAQPSAVNRSLDSRFSVYRWDVGGSKLFQINDAYGQVLVTFFETDGQVSRLPVGAASAQVRLNGAVPATGKQALDAAPSTCPCASNVTYDDGYTRIIATTDSQGPQGHLLDVTAIHYKPRTLPQ